MEASGGYEKLPFALLCSEAIPVAIVNPRAVRRFAQAMGYLEKTDALDAGIIAHFARTKNCKPSAPGSAQQQHLRALVTRLRQLTDLQTAQRNQSRLLSDTTVKTLFEQILALIKTQIRSLEKAIAELIQADPLWQRMEASFRSIKGVAARTISRLMAEMPEIGNPPGFRGLGLLNCFLRCRLLDRHLLHGLFRNGRFLGSSFLRRFGASSHGLFNQHCLQLGKVDGAG